MDGVRKWGRSRMRTGVRVRRLTTGRVVRSFGWSVVSICVYLGAYQLVGAPVSFGLCGLRLTTRAIALNVTSAPVYAVPVFVAGVGTVVLVVHVVFRAVALRCFGGSRRHLWRMTLRCVDSSKRVWLVSATSASLFCVTAAPEWWIVGVALLTLYEGCAVYGFIRRRMYERVRKIMPLCRGCGYNLRGSTGRCPECGTPMTRPGEGEEEQRVP
jgi:hypothetical protein